MLEVLSQKLGEIDGPMAQQVDTLSFFLASTLKGKTDEEIQGSLELVIGVLQEVLTPELALLPVERLVEPDNEVRQDDEF